MNGELGVGVEETRSDSQRQTDRREISNKTRKMGPVLRLAKGID